MQGALHLAVAILFPYIKMQCHIIQTSGRFERVPLNNIVENKECN